LPRRALQRMMSNAHQDAPSKRGNRIALPCVALRCLALPIRAMPCQATISFSAPMPTVANGHKNVYNLALPCVALPRRAQLGPAMPCLVKI